MTPVSDTPKQHLSATLVNLGSCPKDMRQEVIKVILSEDGTAGNKDLQDILTKHPGIISILETLYEYEVFIDAFEPKDLIEMRRTVWGVSGTSAPHIEN